MDKHRQLASFIEQHPHLLSSVVDFDAQKDCLLHFDFTENNTGLTTDVIADTEAFGRWVNHKLALSGCRYGIGGYMEHRTLYARSALFNTAGQEPRRLHLGTDIWGPATTPVYAPLNGTVHSVKNNAGFGDYGPTIILQHNLNGLQLFTLYGHLSTASLTGLKPGQHVAHGQCMATLGAEHENGNWPPHLHFQLMFDMQGITGDYPGVCRYSEKELYRQNVPDPDVILQFSKATIM